MRSAGRRLLGGLSAIALLTAACATPEARAPQAGAPPGPARVHARLDDPADRARFECAVQVQQAQGFDPGASLSGGALFGGVLGAGAGAATGALVGLINDIPGRTAATGAIVGASAGVMIGGLLRLDADVAAYHRGLDACLAAPAAGTRPLPAAGADGLVEYRLRVLNLRDEAFTAYGLSAADLVRLAAAADAGEVRGGILYDRHPVPVPKEIALAWGATPVEARVRLLDGARDMWDEVRWHGRPGERSVWTVTARNRRPQAIRHVALSDAVSLALFRPLASPLFGGRREAATSVPLGYLSHAEAHGTAGAYAGRYLDLARGIAVVVGANDDAVFPDRAYLVVTHGTAPATYEAVLSWAGRGGERDGTGARSD